MLGAEDPGARLEDLLLEVSGAREVALFPEGGGEVTLGGEFL